MTIITIITSNVLILITTITAPPIAFMRKAAYLNTNCLHRASPAVYLQVGMAEAQILPQIFKRQTLLNVHSKGHPSIYYIDIVYSKLTWILIHTLYIRSLTPNSKLCQSTKTSSKTLCLGHFDVGIMWTLVWPSMCLSLIWEAEISQYSWLLGSISVPFLEKYLCSVFLFSIIF